MKIQRLKDGRFRDAGTGKVLKQMDAILSPEMKSLKEDIDYMHNHIMNNLIKLSTENQQGFMKVHNDLMRVSYSLKNELNSGEIGNNVIQILKRLGRDYSEVQKISRNLRKNLNSNDKDQKYLENVERGTREGIKAINKMISIIPS